MESRPRRCGASGMAVAAALLLSLSLVTSGCSTAGPASPLKPFSALGSEAALARQVEKDPFPSAAERGLGSVAPDRR